MKNNNFCFLLFCLLSASIMVKGASGEVASARSTESEVQILEITETTLSEVYYHMQSFTQPTCLVFTNLLTVEGYIYFHQNTNLVGVEFPVLENVEGYLYFYGNTSLESISAPNLRSVVESIDIAQNPGLITLDLCKLEEILSMDEFYEPEPYYNISGNKDSVDSVQPCWGSKPPVEIILSDSLVRENEPAGTLIGNISIIPGNPGDSILIYLPEPGEYDNDAFEIRGNELYAKRTFDFETGNEFVVEIVARNQYGEKLQSNFTVQVLNIELEEFDVVEITDVTLSGLSYHQQGFESPTKLVFTNLVTVEGDIYFHENTNLVGVEFPVLETTGGHFYFSGNLSLESILAPNLYSVYDYLYIRKNTSLSVLDVCNLSEILSSDEFMEPNYLINSNTALVDAVQPCWGSKPPAEVLLSDSLIKENEAAGSLIGFFSAITEDPGDSVIFSLVPGENDNEAFELRGNELVSRQIFDFEANNEYIVEVEVRNLFGDKLSQRFAISVLDMLIEGLDTLEITDVTLGEVYYHAQCFERPTKLVFPNLTSVEGIIHFHGNVNLSGLEFPNLESAGGYFYCSDNISLEKVSAPNLESVGDYVYISRNTLLKELHICKLAEIIPSSGDGMPYYYIKDNPLLDFGTTCLAHTTLSFMVADSIQFNSDDERLLGYLNADIEDGDTISYFFVDDNGGTIFREDLFFKGNEIYLSDSLDSESDHLYSFNIGALRYQYTEPIDTIQFKSAMISENKLNEKIVESFYVAICAPRYYLEEDSICEGESLLWQGSTYDSGGTYRAFYKTALSCDSIYELILHTRPAPDVDISAPSDVYLNETVIIEAQGLISDDMVFNWDFNQGSIISGAGAGPYEISWNSQGLKTVTLDVTAGGCSTILSSDILCSDFSGGLPPEKDGDQSLEDIRIWPNPADERLYLAPGIPYSLLELSIWSVDGVQQIYLQEGECSSEIDISTLNSGVYVIKLRYEGGSKSLKMIKR